MYCTAKNIHSCCVPSLKNTYRTNRKVNPLILDTVFRIMRKVHLNKLTVGSTSTNSLNILALNIRSLRGKLADLTNLVQSYKDEIHVLIINETWLNADETKLFNLNIMAASGWLKPSS